jgi:hypothetical protein
MPDELPAVEEAPKMPEHLLAEYQEVCDHYRKGWDLVLAGGRLFLVIQAGLAAAFGFLATHKEIQQTIQVSERMSVKLAILIISFIGLWSGPVALIVALRSYKYHDAVASRGIALEKKYGMKLLQSLDKVWHGGRVAGATVTLVLFLFMAAFWIVGIWQSFVMR